MSSKGNPQKGQIKSTPSTQWHVDEYKYKDPDFIRNFEEEYPEMTREFKLICLQQYDLFCQKQADYGPTNIPVDEFNGDKVLTRHFTLLGLWFRMRDKFKRLVGLLLLEEPNRVSGESMIDSFQDLSNYGIIAQLIDRNKWGK